VIATQIPDAANLVKKVSISRISYSSDGLKINGFIVRPNKSGRFPCIIYNRGGMKDLGSIDDFRLVRFMSVIASWDYIVIASQYRGAMGSEGADEYGGNDVNDVMNLFLC
jgi:dipeptidyl aminopeptidase/acylaminoacyl peptidase